MSTTAISPSILSHTDHFHLEQQHLQQYSSSSPSTPIITTLPSTFPLNSMRIMQAQRDYFNSPHHSSVALDASTSSNSQSPGPTPPAFDRIIASPIDDDDELRISIEGGRSGKSAAQSWTKADAQGIEAVRGNNISARDGGQIVTRNFTQVSASPSSSDEDPSSAKQAVCTEILRTPSASTTQTQRSATESLGCESQDSNGAGTVPSSVASSSRHYGDLDGCEETEQNVGASPASLEQSEKSRGKMRRLDYEVREDPDQIKRSELAEDTIVGSSREGSESTSTPAKTSKELGESDRPFASRPSSPILLSSKSGISNLTSPRSKSSPAQTSRDAARPRASRHITSPSSSSPPANSTSTDPLQAQRKLRRLYALLELVDTERSYAQDMDALVRVYFSQLSSMPFFSSGSQSAASASNHSKSSSKQNNDLSSASSSTTIATSSAPAATSSIAVSQTPAFSSSASASSAPPSVSTLKPNPVTLSADNVSASLSHLPSSSAPSSANALPQEKHSVAVDRLRAVVRNADELYQLTTRISAGLTAIVAEAGIAGEDLNKTSIGLDRTEKSEMDNKIEIAMGVNAEAAVHVIAEYFTTLAPSFSVYRTFASRHAEALAVVREAERRTSDWAAYEKRCADILRRNNGSWSSSNSTANSRVNTPAGSRRGSDAVKPSGLTVTPIDPEVASCLAEEQSDPSFAISCMESATSTSPSFSRQASSTPPNTRLVFADLFIKPIQRLCLLPLMLQSVLKLTSQDDPARPQLVEAVKAMRQVADDVDEAGRQREMQVLAHLITYRMEKTPIPNGPSSYSSASSGNQSSNLLNASASPLTASSNQTAPNGGAEFLHAQNCTLTPSHLGAFGPCLLAGSLDVLHHHPKLNPLSLPLRFKYHGVFLYGSWLMFVKVQTRRPHAFEARHWFPLWAARLTCSQNSNREENRPLLPHSFRISVHEHHFECGASTAAEKQIWLDALSNSIQSAEVAPPSGAECASWPSSLQLVADGELEEEEDDENIGDDDERSAIDLKRSGGRDERKRTSVADPLSSIWAQFSSNTSISMLKQSANGVSTPQPISSSIPLKLASPSQRASHDRYMLASQSLLAARTRDSSAAHDAVVLWQKQHQHSLSVPYISAAVSSRMGLNKLSKISNSNSQSVGLDSQPPNSTNFNSSTSPTGAPLPTSKLQRRKSFASVLDLVTTMTASPESIMRQHQLQHQPQQPVSPDFNNVHLPETPVDSDNTWRSTFKRKSSKSRPSTMIITSEMLANVAAQAEAAQPESFQTDASGSELASPQVAAQSPRPAASLSPPLPPPLDLSSVSPNSIFAPDGSLLPISAASNASQAGSSPGMSPRISPQQSRTQSQVRLSSSDQAQLSNGHNRSRSGAGTSLSQAVKDALSASYAFYSYGGTGGKRSRTRSAQTDASLDSSIASDFVTTPPNLSPLGATIALPKSRRNSVSAVISPSSALISEFGADGGALGLIENSNRKGGSLSRGSGASIKRAFTSSALTPNWSRHQQQQQLDQSSESLPKGSFRPFMNSKANSSKDSISLRTPAGSSALAALRNPPIQVETSKASNNRNAASSSLLKSGFSLRRARSGSVTSIQESILDAPIASLGSSPSNGSSSTLLCGETLSGSNAPDVWLGGSVSKKRWPKLRSGSSSGGTSEALGSSPVAPSTGLTDSRRPSFSRRFLSNRFSMTSSGVSRNSHSSPSVFNSASIIPDHNTPSNIPSVPTPPSPFSSSRRTSELDSVVESETCLGDQNAQAAVGNDRLETSNTEVDTFGAEHDRDRTIKSRPKITKRPSTTDGIVQKKF